MLSSSSAAASGTNSENTLLSPPTTPTNSRLGFITAAADGVPSTCASDTPVTLGPLELASFPRSRYWLVRRSYDPKPLFVLEGTFLSATFWLEARFGYCEKTYDPELWLHGVDELPHFPVTKLE